MDRWFAATNRLRTGGTDYLLAAAAGISHVVAQTYASWNGIRQGGWVKTEKGPSTCAWAPPVMNPDKLRSLGPPAALRSVMREAYRLRRPVSGLTAGGDKS